MVLLYREGQQVSTSMVGRILQRLKGPGGAEAACPQQGEHPLPMPTPSYAIGKPRDYRVEGLGDPDCIGVDTRDIRPLPGVALKHFTARDVVSRWDVLEAHRQATAARFLDTLPERLPFPLKALQVDGGAEFAAQFEAECQQRGIRLFVLPPLSLSSRDTGCSRR